MYEAYFQMQRRPFSATPDANCFFASDSIQELFDQLVVRAESGEGVSVVTGVAGVGKTLLCRRIVSELTPQGTPIFLANANLPTRRALLQSILFELGRKYSGMDEQELRLATFGVLRELTVTGRDAVLIVDEAHLLSDRLLEELRLLASLAEESKPLARLILVGQPALEERLVSHALDALNQRINCQLFLDTLTHRESIEYVEFRIAWAGCDASQIFEDSALEAIASASSGLPRCLNHLCDHALLLTCVQERPRVTSQLVADALHDLKHLPLQWNIPVDADPLVVESSRVDEADDDFEDEVDGEEIPGAPLAHQSHRSLEISQPTSSTTSFFEIGGGEVELVEATSDDEQSEMDFEADSEYEAETDDHLPAWNQPAPVTAASIPVPPMMAPPIVSRDRSELVSEPLFDRYAQLDAVRPRVTPTFDGNRLPDGWEPLIRPDVPGVPEPPALLEPIVIEERFEHPVELPAEIRPTMIVTPVVDYASTDHSADVPPVSLESQLHESIVEAVRDVRSAVEPLAKFDTVLPQSVVEERLAQGEVIDAQVEPFIDSANRYIEYDVVQPEESPDQVSRNDLFRDRRVDEPEEALRPRNDAKPRGGMLFSALRRRFKNQRKPV